jgi:phage recombination protein Bet
LEARRVTAALTTPQETGRVSLLETLAAKYNLEPARLLATVKATIFDAKGSQEELIAFLTVANRYNLDPFCGEVFAFRKQGGGIQAVVGVDGWSSILNSHPMMDGMEFEDKLDDKGELIAVTCKLYRKDRTHPVTCTEYMKECKRNTQPWTQWPRRMLRHKATIQCARLAFGLTGIIDPDEADRFEAAAGAPVGSKVQSSKLNQILDAMPSGSTSAASEAQQATTVDQTKKAPQESRAQQRDGVDEPSPEEPDADDALAQAKQSIADGFRDSPGIEHAKDLIDYWTDPQHDLQLRTFATICFEEFKERSGLGKPKKTAAKKGQAELLDTSPEYQ